MMGIAISQLKGNGREFVKRASWENITVKEDELYSQEEKDGIGKVEDSN